LQKARDLLEIKVNERTAKLRNEIEQRKRMQAEMDAVHRQLVDASRRAGQAEVATTVLHNVGNVLNSVNTSTGIVSDLMRGLPGDGITKVVALLEEHRANLAEFLCQDTRGAQVINYLRSLDRHLASRQASISSELRELRENVEHINQIVAMQQGYAKVSHAIEPQSLSELVEDALRMNAGGLERLDVEIVRNYDELPQLMLDKHKILQILVNLISNAQHALGAESVLQRRLAISIHRQGDELVRITVSDTGLGIDPANLTRIFAHGFTTRKDGHGFGLHSGALAANGMGGSLRAESNGLGKGAAFVLELPYHPVNNPFAPEIVSSTSS
jgi:C4-dicarboxylate-specific signal transduction histidine kinase